MKKKIFSLILALVMVFSLALSVSATESSETTEATGPAEAATEAASEETTAPAEVETATKSGMSPTVIFCLVLIVFGLLIVTQSKNLNKIGKKMKKNKKKK